MLGPKHKSCAKNKNKAQKIKKCTVAFFQGHLVYLGTSAVFTVYNGMLNLTLQGDQFLHQASRLRERNVATEQVQLSDLAGLIMVVG